jgi:hypothetical protein
VLACCLLIVGPGVAAAATVSVTDITHTSATLNASVNPGGVDTACVFQLGTTPAYGMVAQCVPQPGSGTTPVPVSATVHGLAPGTAYHVRLETITSGGTTDGEDAVFDTLPAGAPEVTTGAASDVTGTTATIAGTVDPNGADTTCQFEYGTSTAYGSSAPCPAGVGADDAPLSTSVALTGLTAGTTYHYRLVATNTLSTTDGADATFTTTRQPVCDPPALLGCGCGLPVGDCGPPPCEANPYCHVAVIELTRSVALVTGGRVALALRCFGGAACHAPVRLVAKVKVAVRRRGSKRVVHKLRSVTIGERSVSLAQDATTTASVPLTRAGRALLARARSLHATVSTPDPALDNRARSYPVTLKARARRKARRG